MKFTFLTLYFLSLALPLAIGSEKVCGDLAFLSGKFEYCEFREEEFVLDSRGYRNGESHLTQIDTLVFGDSFVFGQGISQLDTITSKLEKKFGKPFYNGGGKLQTEYLMSHIKFLKKDLKTILYFHLERHRHEVAEVLNLIWGVSKDGGGPKPYDKALQGEGLQKKQLDGDVLGMDGIREGVLSNGMKMLFHPASVKNSSEKMEMLPDTGSYFSSLNLVLKQMGIRLVVVLVPEKFTVYEPFIKGDSIVHSELYLNTLDEELKTLGVESLNLVAGLRTEASDLLGHRGLVFFSGDSHWNARGVQVAADLLESIISP